MPLVSIKMPSYNHERYIAEAIESVLNQTVKDFELIIIDDGSTDKSRDIIEDFKRKDERIKAVFHTENKGIAETFNEAMRVAKGKYMAYISSDDIWIKDKLERQLVVLAKNENLIVWSDGEIINEKGVSTGETFTHLHRPPQKKKSGNIFEILLNGNFIFGSSFIALKKNLKDLTYCDRLKYLNDWLFYIELAENYQFYFIEAPLAKYRIHEHNTNKDKIGYLLDAIKFKKIIINRYGNRISRKAKSEFYFQIGENYEELRHALNARLYVLRALITYPLNLDARYYFTKRLKTRYPYLALLFKKYFNFLWHRQKSYL